MAHTPNRALARATLEALAWQTTPTDYRGGSGLRRAVLVNAPDGTTLMPLSELTDNQLRKYIGPKALEEAGDMKKNGKGIYHGSAAGTGDYVIHHHRGSLWVDRVGSGGTHTSISPARGYSTFAEAWQGILDDRMKRGGRGTWAGYEQVGDELQEIGSDDPRLHGHARNSSRGVYADITPSPGDYVMSPRRSAYPVNRVEEDGTRTVISPEGGYSTFAEAWQGISDDRRRRGSQGEEGFTFEVVDNDLVEIEDDDPRLGATHMRKNGKHGATLRPPRRDRRLTKKHRGQYELIIVDVNGNIVAFQNTEGGHKNRDGTWRYAVDGDRAAQGDIDLYESMPISGYFPNASRERLPHGGYYVDYGAPVFVIGDDVEGKDGSRGKVLDTGSERGRLEYRVKLHNGEILWFDENELVIPTLRQNARREEADEHAARELSLFIENDYALVGAPNSLGKAIEKNLLAKIRNGSFDLGKSEQAWMYLMEEGAKKYAKEFASEREWSRIFNPATRELVAHEFAVTFYDENKGS